MGVRGEGASNTRRGKSTWIGHYLSDEFMYPERLFRRIFGVPSVLLWLIHAELLDPNPDYWGTR